MTSSAIDLKLPSMAGELPQSLEGYVLRRIIGGFKSQELWNAERPEGAPYVDQDRALVLSFASIVQRQGTLLALLTLNPFTREELQSRMPGMVDRAPAWLEARVRGEAMTWTTIMRGLAQTMREHRLAMERVVFEQVRDAEEIKTVLSEAPVPALGANEDRSQLMEGVGKVLSAHTKALADIAYDLEINHGVSVDFKDL